jgi:Tetracyclin repressor-like, C-terminal domain
VDLRSLARSLVRFLASPHGQAVTAVTLSDAGRIPEVDGAQRRRFEDRYRQAEPVIARAIARGELPAGTDPAEVVRSVLAPIYLRVLVTAEPISLSVADGRRERSTRRRPRRSAVPAARYRRNRGQRSAVGLRFRSQTSTG